jgi:hypothetical protein
LKEHWPITNPLSDIAFNRFTYFQRQFRDTHFMGFRFRRSFKLLPGIRLNLGKRGISTSIGVRGAHVTFGASGTRTTVGLPGSGLSYTHLEKSHHAAPAIPALPLSGAQPAPATFFNFAGLAVFWISLIVYLIVLAGHSASTPTPVAAPLAVVSPAKAVTPGATGSQAGETQQALRGDALIRYAVHNASSLKYVDVAVMPQGAVCYQFELTNSHGVKYPGAAVLERGQIKTSTEDGFATLWASHCAHLKAGRSLSTAFASGLPRG